MAGTPLHLTFYNPDDSIKQEYVKSHIPAGILDTALELWENIDQDNLTRDDLQNIYNLIVELFGDQFSSEELKKCADLEEMLAVVEQIQAKFAASFPKASSPAPLPGKPRTSRKRH